MTRRLKIDDLTDLAVPSQPALSPDGDRVVYVLRTLDAGEDRNVDQLWSVPTSGGTPRRLTAGNSRKRLSPASPTSTPSTRP